MNVIILGAGGTGAHVAASLAQEKHNVILIDSDAKKLEEISRKCDIATLHTQQPSWQALHEVGKPDLFFAATRNDELNFAACTVAKALQFPKIVARVRQKIYLNHASFDFRKFFGADFLLSSEALAAQDLYKMLIHAADISSDHFAHGAIQMRTIQMPLHWDRSQTPIAKLSLPSDVMVSLIRRGDTTLIPHGEDSLLLHDQVTVIGEAKAMRRLNEWFNVTEKPVSSVIIVGGSLVATNLIELLCHHKIDVRLVEKDADRCQKLASLFPEITILNRDAASPDWLRSEKIEEADAFIASTSSDEANLLIASLAKQAGCRKAIAQLTDPQVAPILEKLEIIPALSAKVNAANRIAALLDEHTTLSVGSLSCDAIKVLELKVHPSSKAVGQSIAALSLPKGILIAMIENQGKTIIGKGQHIFQPEDTLIAICQIEHIPKLQQLFHE